MTGIVCGVCGHRNPPGANFCSSCGTALRDEPDARTDTLHLEAITDIGDEYDVDRSQFPADTGILVVTRGPNAGSRFVLDAERTTAGRHPDSDIFLDDITVSRKHAVFTRSGDVVTVEDQGSLNGTYVNRTVIDAPTELHDGDVVMIGKFRLTFFASQHGVG